jgi:hypothetical protein
MQRWSRENQRPSQRRRKEIEGRLEENETVNEKGNEQSQKRARLNSRRRETELQSRRRHVRIERRVGLYDGREELEEWVKGSPCNASRKGEKRFASQRYWWGERRRRELEGIEDGYSTGDRRSSEHISD